MKEDRLEGGVLFLRLSGDLSNLSSYMSHIKKAVSLFSLLCAQSLYAQAAKSSAQPGTDVLVFTDGERMIGHLERANHTSVVFTSNMVGEITVDWAKIQELRSPQAFAVIPKDLKLKKKDVNTVPQGPVAMTDQRLQVTGAGARTHTTPVEDVGNVVDEAAYQAAFRRMSLLEGWKGNATAGLALTHATQTSHTFTAAVNFVRSVPDVDWLNVRSRTIFNYTQAYGSTSERGFPTIKTSLFRIAGEHDWFLSSRLYTFAGAAFDHNFSQGLSLQQTYGGGIGLVLFKTELQEFDVKASMDYIIQQFQISSFNKHLIGSVFSESYSESFFHGILLNEQGGFSPAWNDSSAYSAFASAGLTFPVYHHFGLTLGVLDNYLNTAPPGFNKNSFQFTLGATYLFR